MDVPGPTQGDWCVTLARLKESGQLAYANGIEDHRLDELILFPTGNEEPGHLVVMI